MSSLSDYYRRRPESADPAAPDLPVQPVADGKPHDAGAFQIQLPQGWSDQTLHVFAGPIEDAVQHTVTVAVDREIDIALEAYVDGHIAALEAQLKALTVLKREPAYMQNGLPGIRAVFDWYPAEGKRVIQEQLYVLKGKDGLRLTATYSPTTFETLGPEIRSMMLSLVPT